jgi:hypothetical protein
VFITHDAAARGVQIENAGSEPMVSLRYFGPDVHKNMPAIGEHRIHAVEAFATEKVISELVPGVKSLLNLAHMIRVAVSPLKTQAFVSAKEYYGSYFSDRKFFLGIYWDAPGTLTFETQQMPVKENAAELIGFGNVEPNDDMPSGRMWSHKHDLASTNFYDLTAEKQQEFIVEFVNRCVEAIQRIGSE